MKRTTIATLLFLGSVWPALAGIVTEGPESGAVQTCEQIPEAATIQISTVKDATLCGAASLLDGVRSEDVQTFAKAVTALKRDGYGGSDSEVASQLAAIVKLRGLDGKPDRWLINLNIVVREYQFYSGGVTPRDAIRFLSAVGPMAESLSDEDFKTALILIQERKHGAD